MRYFISGHLTTTQAEFDAHYLPELERVLRTDTDASFVIGDAKGTDQMAQAWCRDHGFMARTTVYHMLSRPRHNLGPFAAHGGFQTDDARDSACTIASDRDIAWVRPGREASGTARNIARRAGTPSEGSPS